MKIDKKTVYVWLGVLVACLAGTAGCGADSLGPPAKAQRTTLGTTVDQVCKTTAELMRIDQSKIGPQTSLAELGADELDFVELVMELEDRFDISLPDETLEGMMGTNNWQQGMKNVTMAKLAAVIEDQNDTSAIDAEGLESP
jgi:acyl carrier protein